MVALRRLVLGRAVDDALEEVDALRPVREAAGANVGRTLQVVHVANIVPIFRKAKLCLAFLFMIFSWVFAGGVLSIQMDGIFAATPPMTPPLPSLPPPVAPPSVSRHPSV